MPTIPELRDELAEEVGIILSSQFEIEVTNTNSVPHSGDPAITFPNLDAATQGCKLIDTCVLYIDIRRSTELNLNNKPETVAKLYSAFVRAMTKCARHYRGHVRGIIGDRVMVLYDKENAFENAVSTAILMNSTCQYILNEYFKSSDVKFGIGIDAGKMLVTKTGFRRKGVEQHNYKNLVWLGRAANVASKLTDQANKPSEIEWRRNVHVAYDYGFGWVWRDETLEQFVDNLSVQYCPSRVVHSDPKFGSFFKTQEPITIRPDTPTILMTSEVFEGYKTAKPDDPTIVNGWFDKVDISVAGYTGQIYGGNVIKASFR